ncbi:unnamed protein product [Dovyalis caffra]|uniref:Pentatricopeptide repeat-containing protein n=1 Tax=Dovyalis caffra TaxID=77055 RepID=A0AAV1SI68_9ROSI|nr:unnamed protein product [Dovyalis caffra]
MVHLRTLRKPRNHNTLPKPSQKNGMSSLSRLIRRTFSSAASAAATTTATSVTSAKAKSLSQILYEERNLKELVEKFKNASLDDHFRTRNDIYKVTIRRLAAARKFHYVEEILEDQKQYKDMSAEDFNARLMNLYGIAGMFDNARKVFDEMLERNCPRTVMSLNALLGACVNSKKFDEVEGLLKGLSKELKIEPDLVSYNMVVKAFCEMGSLDSAVSLLDEMEKKGLVPDLITFTTLLHGFYENGRVDDGERIWDRMKEKSIEPDLITFNTLLHGFYANGRFVDGEQIWDRMKEKNVEPDNRSYGARVLGMALEKKMKDAVKVVEEMKSRGLKLNHFIYHDLIRGFVNEDDLEEAKHWYGDIRENGCKPNRYTFETLIPFSVEKGDLAFAFELCEHVILSKFAVKKTLIQPVVDALAKESKIKAAKELVHLGKSRRPHPYNLKLPRSSEMSSLISVFHPV